MPQFEMECGPKCRSRQHASDINAAITKGSLAEVQAYCRLCFNGGQMSDKFGRTALHIAAACGKTDIVEWLLEEKHADVTQKDGESGWTALHRAVFYGQLATANLLIQYKSDLYTRDHDGLGPLDIAMKDQSLQKGVPPPVYRLRDLHEVYTWGDNSNYTLGHKSEHRRSGPEVVDEFRKLGVKMKQIVMCKYHTVFLTEDGTVYTCGHGQGGRLGHPTEGTCVVPKQIMSLKSEVVTQIAAARDHTVFLMQNHHVYSCGLNQYHQLGVSPPPEKCLVPKQVDLKVLRGKNVVGVCAGRFHTVLYTKDSVFTFGLNAGQLGHPKLKNDRRISQPRQVSRLNEKDIQVVMVTCSDAATVVLTGNSDIYVLHEYHCFKIASKWQQIKTVQVVGGVLDHSDSQILRENGGKELVISLLNKSGKVFIWRKSSPLLKRAHWMIKRQLVIKDYVFTESNMAIVTTDGEAFSCTFTNKCQQTKEVQHSNKEPVGDDFGQISLLDLLLQDKAEEVQVRRLPNIHRASYITGDKKGRNFAGMQSLPHTCLTDIPTVSLSTMVESFDRLLDEADEFDTIHDIVLQCHGHSWPAHKFILMARCSNFQSVCNQYSNNNNDSEKMVINITDVHPQILEQLLKFVYTDSCDLLKIGAKFSLAKLNASEDIFQMDMEPEISYSGDHNMSAFEVYQKNKGNKNGSSHTKGLSGENPVKLLQDQAERWGIKGLEKRLEAMIYSRGHVLGKQQHRQKLSFSRHKYSGSRRDLSDVSIQSEDGHIFHCHKCVLVARLEYFHSMLASGWMETSSSSALTLPIPGDILEILLDFLYTDDSSFVSRCENVELLCNILVVADQMLVTRLKEICEDAIATLITLRNVADLLEFASTYNADQLKATCQQYIAINGPALFESRLLDMLSEEVMEELTQYYRNLIPNMSRRMITPFDEGPEKVYLESLVAAEIPRSPLGSSVDPKKQKSKKKRRRTKSTTEDQEVKGQGSQKPRRVSERQLSISSDISAKSDEDLVEVIESLSVEENLETSPKRVLVPDLNFSVTKPHPEQNGHVGKTTVVSSPPSVPAGAWFAPREQVSPQGHGEAVSLRDIMEQQEESKMVLNTSGHEKKSSRFSWKDVKKQQQKQQLLEQQKQQQQQQQKSAPESPSSINDRIKQEAPHCPWGPMNKIVESFRSLMVEEQEVRQPPGSKTIKTKTGSSRHTAPATSVVSWGLPKSSSKPSPLKTPDRHGKSPKPREGPVSPRSPDNPWQGLAQSPPEPTSSFSEIVRDEVEKTDTLTKMANKSLELIQMEEQAIQDLLLHYRAASNVDEYITVERVPQVAAAPLWKRERLTSS